MNKLHKPTVKHHMAAVLKEHYLGELHKVEKGVFVDHKDVKVTKKTKASAEKAVKECLKKAGVDMDGLKISIQEDKRLVCCVVVEEDGDVVYSSSVLLPEAEKKEDKKEEPKVEEPVVEEDDKSLEPPKDEE